MMRRYGSRSGIKEEEVGDHYALASELMTEVERVSENKACVRETAKRLAADERLNSLVPRQSGTSFPV